MKWLPENPDVLDEIEKKIREQADALFLGQSEETESVTEEEAAEAAAPEKAPAKKGGKKNVVAEAEEDFEEFSIDEDDE